MSFGGVGLLAGRDSAAEQKGDGRLVFGLEGGEAFGLRCLAGFDFDGDRAPFMFAKEFHFGPALPPTRRVPTKGVEFLRDEIFRMVAFVGTVVLPQYVAHGQAADGSQQAGVEEEEFEKIFLRVRGKGEKAAIDDRVPEHEARSLQPIDRPDDPLVAPQSGYGADPLWSRLSWAGMFCQRRSRCMAFCLPQCLAMSARWLVASRSWIFRTSVQALQISARKDWNAATASGMPPTARYIVNSLQSKPCTASPGGFLAVRP